MREAISGTTLFMIVIFFVVLFTGYLCMSINQNKAFAVKNAIVRVVERNGVGKTMTQMNGVCGISNFSKEISSELAEVGYRSHGKCGENAGGAVAAALGKTGVWVGYNSQGCPTFKENEIVFCLMEIAAKDTKSKSNPNSNLHYYKVKTFYQFDIPVLRSLLNLSIEGTTKPMT